MGLLDKVKQGAGTALNKAQEGVHQGKAKIDQAQAKRQWEALLTKLGEAVYAERRRGGPSEAVDAALAALDEHEATHGPVEDNNDDAAPAASYAAATMAPADPSPVTGPPPVFDPAAVPEVATAPAAAAVPDAAPVAVAEGAVADEAAPPPAGDNTW